MGQHSTPRLLGDAVADLITRVLRRPVVRIPVTAPSRQAPAGRDPRRDEPARGDRWQRYAPGRWHDVVSTWTATECRDEAQACRDDAAHWTTRPDDRQRHLAEAAWMSAAADEIERQAVTR